MDDDALAAATRSAKTGDRRAYDQLVEACQDRLRAALAWHCRSREELDEIAQRAFIAAYQGLQGLEGPFYPWLLGIARNLLRMEIRQRLSRAGHLEHLLAHERQRRLDEPVAADERLGALRACLQGLTTAGRRLLQQHYAEAAPLAELAAEADTTTGAVKQRLLRLREALRRCMERKLA
jgi:RNA polymerase sigma-70 factor, ECF subfamily